MQYYVATDTTRACRLGIGVQKAAEEKPLQHAMYPLDEPLRFRKRRTPFFGFCCLVFFPCFSAASSSGVVYSCFILRLRLRLHVPSVVSTLLLASAYLLFSSLGGSCALETWLLPDCHVISLLFLANDSSPENKTVLYCARCQ